MGCDVKVGKGQTGKPWPKGRKAERPKGLTLVQQSFFYNIHSSIYIYNIINIDGSCLQSHFCILILNLFLASKIIRSPSLSTYQHPDREMFCSAQEAWSIGYNGCSFSPDVEEDMPVKWSPVGTPRASVHLSPQVAIGFLLASGESEAWRSHGASDSRQHGLLSDSL